MISTLQIFTQKLDYSRELKKYFKNVKPNEDYKEEGDELEELEGVDKRFSKKLKQRQANLMRNFKLVHGIKGGFAMPEKF